ncbi:hypothetical protein [Halorubrum sp. HHNYT27]|uniref:hypothetical protein n=1 Tax=Halorubrum sp. HHNYT27 TaxID=3402275 RepID=UPI003EC084CC
MSNTDSTDRHSLKGGRRGSPLTGSGYHSTETTFWHNIIDKKPGNTLLVTDGGVDQDDGEVNRCPVCVTEIDDGEILCEECGKVWIVEEENAV